MLPKNPYLLFGLLGILIPIIIHLLNRRSSRTIEWGAMDFLFQSLAIRNRRIQLEEALLMAARCLLVGLLAMALVRPFVQPGSTVPWLLVLPMVLLGVVGLGVATTLHNEKKWRRIVAIVSILMLLAAAALIFLERHLNLSRFGAAGATQDIALIIDGSTSMTMENDIDGFTNFERAIDEAKTIVKRAPRGHAFSLIIGGPTPAAKYLVPTSNRADLIEALDAARPLDGPMAAYHSLTLASLGLAQGNNDAKQIIILTDAQNVGWENGETSRWSFLSDTFKNLPSEPRVTLRQLPLPDQVRNLALSDITWSREIVGIDRPVEIRVTVENTGNESVTPEAVSLEIDGQLYRDESLGQIQPGAIETVRFVHRFADPGGHAFSAILEVSDEIVQDDRRDAAINVADVLKVLIIDGRSAPRFFDRAASFTALALAPAESRSAATAEFDPDSTDDGGASFAEPERFLVEPQVLPITNILNQDGFDGLDAVILADVPRLPAATADQLLSFVKNGGGLLVAPGQRAEQSFYNTWRDEDGHSLLPAQLGESFVVAPLDEPASPSVATFGHPGLRKIADPAQSDFASVHLTGYWPLTVPEKQAAESSVGARLTNGEAFLVSRQFGSGHVIMLDCSLDTSTGNLPTRQSFLPFIHEVVYQLANPSAYDLNLDAGWDVALHLADHGSAGANQGLRGLYFSDHETRKPTHNRIDQGIDVRWEAASPAPGVPADNFRVEWLGNLQVPVTDNYTFDATADDNLEVSIDGKVIFSSGKRPKTIKLEQGKSYSFQAVLHEGGGGAHAQLYWKSKKLPHQIVPASAFRAAPANIGELDPDAANMFTVVGPDQLPRQAEIIDTGTGTVARINGDIISGLYQLKIPSARRPEFSHFLAKDAESIPFTVKRDSAESHLAALDESDFTFLENYVTISRPGTLDDVLTILSGNDFGRELWKYLALGAFFFLLLEIALSRWIARERRTGETITVDFEAHDAPTSAFQEQLARFKPKKSSKELGASS